MKELVEGFPEIASGGVCAGNMGFIEGWKGWMDIVAMSVKVVMQQGNKKPALTSKDEVARAVLLLILNFRVLKSKLYRDADQGSRRKPAPDLESCIRRYNGYSFFACCS